MTPFAQEERLLVLLNLARPTADQEAEAARLLGSSRLDWEKLYALSELNAVLPLTLSKLTEAGMPAELRERWEAKVAPIRARGQKRIEWVGKLLTALADAGVDVIVLKGSMLAEEIYGDRLYKKMNDVDVLIRREQAEQTIAVIKGLGFQGVGDLFGKRELSEGSHHTPPYVSVDMGCVVGLHWGLSSPLAPWKPDTAGLWRRKVVIQVCGAPAYRMSWEDNLLHLCVHLPFFKTGLRELADVYNLVLGAPLDWDLVAETARRWRAEDAVYRVLALTDALVDLGVPGKYWRTWAERSSRHTLLDTRKRLVQPGLLLRSRSTQAAKIEKAYAVFKLSENYAERARAYAAMWMFLAWPKRTELDKLSGGDHVLRARLRAPGQLWAAMARDHGQLPLVAMTVANAASLLKASARQVVRPGRRGRSLKEHPAYKLLEVLE